MQVKLAQQVFVVHPLWFCLTLTAFLILINLSWWQLSRADAKAQQLHRLAQLQTNGALQSDQLSRLALQDIDGAPLQGNGRWLAPYIWLLDNQVLHGRVGYDVIVPVQMPGLEQPLLVNLGWLAAESSRQRLPEVNIANELELQGLLRTEPDGLPLLGQNAEANGSWPMRIQQVVFTELSGLSGLSLYPALLYQQQRSDFVPHYQPVVLPPEKHRGYALQWFLLAVAVLGVALAASHQGKTKNE